MSPTRVIALLLAVSNGAGCASVVNGRMQTVDLVTNPPGARALILPTHEEVQTPARVELRRKHAHTVLLEREGYCPEIAYLDRVTSAWVYGNLLIGGMIGIQADAESGGGYTLRPDPLEVRLRTLEHCPEPAPERGVDQETTDANPP